MSNDKLLLIDGHAVAYRVFFGLPIEAFTTKSGEPTNATYGFTRTLLDLILGDEPPKYLAVTFDLGKTFRDELFAEYKGTREKMPDELRLQIERIKEVVRTLNIPIFEMEGYEADDLLGTMARQAKKKGVNVHIITGDRDLLQLVDENTVVELPPGPFQRSSTLYDIAGVINKYGLNPPQIVDLKALMGDKSDNIPGVVGVGEKTATKLLQEYETLEGVYANLPEVKTRFRNKLEAGKANAELSYTLAKIITDAPIELDLDACVSQEFDEKAVWELFHLLEFRAFTERLEKAREMTRKRGVPTETIIIRDLKSLRAMIKELSQAEMIAFDVETTSINKMEAELVGICLAGAPPRAYYIPVGHLDAEGQSSSGQMTLFAAPEPQRLPNQLLLQTVLDELRPLMTNPKIGKAAHNAKYDYTILQRYGLSVTPLSFDTMIAEWLTDPSSKYQALKELSQHRLGVAMTPISTLIGKGAKQKSFALVPIEDAAPYGAADAAMTWRLVKPLQEEMTERKVSALMQELELPLIPVLAQMEQAGILIDPQFFATMRASLKKEIGILEEKIYEVAGRTFNIKSTQQLSDVLFKEMNLPHERFKKTKSGHFSTSASVLESLRPADESGIIDALLTYREMVKLKSTYVDALPALVHKETGRLHTSFNQTGSVTGRLASQNPNLQNIPIRTEMGRQIRAGFVAPEGWLLLAADYSQVELRILAHVSQDERLLEAFRQDQDIHRTTAAAVYGIDAADVTYDQRRFAKAVNFGLIYGMGAFRLSRDSDLTLAESENYIKEYFERFPGIQTYLDETKDQARRDGFVTTLLGRRRYFPVFINNISNRNLQMQAEREAVNHPIQGTAADITKIAMIHLAERLKAGGFKARMLLQVHDELLLELPEEELEAVEALMLETMSGAYALDVPLKVEASSGKNWLELKG